MRKATIGILIGLLAISSALAEPTIELTDWILDPDTADQEIQILVYSDHVGGEDVGGLNFNIQVNQFGTTSSDPNGPKIRKTGFSTGLDCISGTIFDGNYTPDPPTDVDGPDEDAFPQFEGASFVTDVDTVTLPEDPPALLATVTFDTTGIQSGKWDLSLINTINGPTNFAGVAANITDGTITVGPDVPDVPEPTSLVLLLLGWLTLPWWRRPTRRIT